MQACPLSQHGEVKLFSVSPCSQQGCRWSWILETVTCRSRAQRHPQRGSDVDGKANVMVQESCKKNIQMLNVLHSAHLSPAAPGRTNTKQLLFFCTWEKMCVGFSGDLAHHIQAAVAGPCGQHGKRVTSSAGFVCSQQSCPVLSCWLGTSWHVPVQTCGLSQRLHCSHHLLSSGPGALLFLRQPRVVLVGKLKKALHAAVAFKSWKSVTGNFC